MIIFVHELNRLARIGESFCVAVVLWVRVVFNGVRKNEGKREDEEEGDNKE